MYQATPEKVWYKNILALVQSLSEQIRKIQQQEGKRDEETWENRKHFISKLILVTAIRPKPTFGMNLYLLNCSKEFMAKFLEEKKVQLEQKVYLGSVLSWLCLRAELEAGVPAELPAQG